jgi:hypothetical protein
MMEYSKIILIYNYYIILTIFFIYREERKINILEKAAKQRKLAIFDKS